MGRNKARGNRQRRQVNWISHRYPTAWQQADALRHDQRHTWPHWCYLPAEHWYAIAKPCWPEQRATPEGIVDFNRLAALGAWRVTQGIYRFDPDLYAALIATPLTGDLPDELLYRLPSWGVYLETPGLRFDGCEVLGVYASLDYIPHDGHTELRLLLDSESALRLFPVVIPLGQGTLPAALQHVSDSARDKMERHFPEKRAAFTATAEQNDQDVRDLTPILSLLLYLCADEADYERPPPIKTARPKALGGKRIVIVPENVRYWEVGARIGAALRTARQDAKPATEPAATEPTGTERQRPRPHWRRAHWHTYLSGPRDGERVARLKWLPPIAVGLDGQPLPAVIHPVR